MKYVVTMMVLALFAGKMALADDSASMEKSDKTSENPVTGTVTHTQKMSKKHKDIAGNMHSKKVTKKSKAKTSGAVDTTTTTEEHHD
ncbi:MAG: hypothetical protein ACXWQO_05590 [Bdellovibrionota bacterium]